ncbi:MAG TPA: hypothetical protein VK508_16805 [Cyclobacteriaceae bacterium]|nr:hypothetical protein [Cyclobacteriaceae bacterium]
MKEASLVKFYFAKYFLLTFGLLQWIISAVFLINQRDTPKGQWSAFLFFTIGLVILSLQIILATRLKRVAIGKKKITVMIGGTAHRYEHDEIKTLKFIPAFNVYKMKIRGKKGHMYFLPCEESEVIYGMFPSAIPIAKKNK